MIAMIALHSAVLGLLFILAPGWAAVLGGWERLNPPLFGRLAGGVLIVLAAGYLIEFARCRGIGLILVAKILAFVSLSVLSLLTPLPWAVPTSGVLDGLLALVVWCVHRRAQASTPLQS